MTPGRKRKLRNYNYEHHGVNSNFANGTTQEQTVMGLASLQLSSAVTATDMSLLKESVLQLCRRMTALEDSYRQQASETRVLNRVAPPPLPNLLAIMGSVEKVQKRESPEVELIEPPPPSRKWSSSSSDVGCSSVPKSGCKKIRRTRANKEATGGSPDSSYFSDVGDSGVGGLTPVSVGTLSASQDLPWTGNKQPDADVPYLNAIDDLADVSSTLHDLLVPETFVPTVESVLPEPDAELMNEFLEFCETGAKVDASTSMEVSRQEAGVQTCCGGCNSGSCIEQAPSIGSIPTGSASSSKNSSGRSRSSSGLKLPVFAQLPGIKVEKQTAPRCYVNLQDMAGQDDVIVGDHWMRRVQYCRNGQKTNRWLLVHHSNKRKFKRKQRTDQPLHEKEM